MLFALTFFLWRFVLRYLLLCSLFVTCYFISLLLIFVENSRLLTLIFFAKNAFCQFCFSLICVYVSVYY